MARMRWWFLPTLVVLSLSLIVVRFASGQTPSKVTLTYAGSGGPMMDALKKAWFEPYTKAHPNVTILTDSPVNYAKIKAMVEAKSVTWDIVEVGSDFGLTKQTDLLERIDCNVVDCRDLQPDRYQTTGFRATYGIFPIVVAYRTDLSPPDKAPQVWADFYDLKKFSGKRVLWKARPQYILESALVADGVDPKNLYPLDAERAFRKLDTIKSDIVWAATSQQCAQMLSDRVGVMAFCFFGRIYNIQQQGVPAVIPWRMAFTSGGYFVVPKGTKNPSEVMKLIAYMTSAEHNAEMSYSNVYPVLPVNTKALNKVDSSKTEALGVPYLDRTISVNDIWWGDNLERLNQRWQEWLLR